MTCHGRHATAAAWALGALLALALAVVAAPAADALPRLPACADNVESDAPADGRVDWPLDPGCASATDTTEFDPATGSDPVTQCSDGASNDTDARIDFPSDPGCQSAVDNSEGTATSAACSDGANNGDGDASSDFPADPGCIAGSDDSEADRHCADALDNDNDLRTDFPADFGCSVPTAVTSPAGVNQNDNDETDPPQCNDGRDNDGDGTLDFGVVGGQTADTDCASATDTVEATPPPPSQCSDGFDNDLDGALDFPADPGCGEPSDNDETDPPPVPAPFTPPPTAGSGPTRARLLAPFPIVRLRGNVDPAGVRVTLLSIRAPALSKVSVYCTGASCPRKRTVVHVGRKLVRVRRFERQLRGGTILKIYVTRAGFVGKYTRFRFVKSGVPMRADRCASMPGALPRPCPR